MQYNIVQYDKLQCSTIYYNTYIKSKRQELILYSINQMALI